MKAQTHNKDMLTVEVLQDALTKIKIACDHADGLTKGDKLDKAQERIKTRIISYMNIYMSSVESGQIVADPYGIVNKQCLPNKFARKCVDLYIKGHQGSATNAGQSISRFDLVSIKSAILSGSTKIKGKLANGVKWTYDKANDTMVFSYFLTKSYIRMVASKIKQGWTWFCETMKSMFVKEESIAKAA